MAVKKAKRKKVTAQQLRADTKKDLDRLLLNYNKGSIIRPTGWGKTWLLAELVKDYDKVLYIYPTDVIKNTVVDRIEDLAILDHEAFEAFEKYKSCDKITLMSYYKLQSLTEDDIRLEYNDFDLIIFDEAHRMMAKGAKRAIDAFFKYCPDSKFVGATATPVRTDPQDFVSEFFDGLAVYSYTLHDAFEDGLLQKPYYCYCTTDMKKISNDLKENALTAGEDFYKMFVKEVLDKQLAQVANLYNMENIVKDVCDNHAPDGTSYMKFICFFSNIKHLKAKSKEVIKWFHTSYPNHEINTLSIFSKGVEKKNVDKLDEMKPTSNRIDLIFCVEMLNMGYHVDNLTGIVMYRGTISDIVYTQQLGRALSSGSSHHCIVFDIVDNVHRKAVWDVTNTSIRTGNGNRGPVINYDDYRNKSDQEKLSVGARKEVHDGKTLIILPDEFYNRDTKKIEIAYWRNVSRIYPQDIIMTGHEASYRELIAKAVGESLSKRCLEALELHFKRFCRDKGLPFPHQWTVIKQTYGYDRADVVKDLIKVIRSGRYPYPLGDEEKILKAATLPLEAFAKWKDVSVRNILDILEVQ